MALAREVAEKSTVLLKNDPPDPVTNPSSHISGLSSQGSNNILPSDKDKTYRGDRSLADLKQTGDHGSSSVYPSYIVSPLEGIRTYFSGTNTEVLYVALGDTQAIKYICTNADAVIVSAGMTYLDEGEYIGNGGIRDQNNPDKMSFFTKLSGLGLGGDRRYMHLHPQDLDVIHLAASVNKKVVVCLVAGSAVTVEEWHTEVPAILETFYNGMEGGNALARILFGDVNPSANSLSRFPN